MRLPAPAHLARERRALLAVALHRPLREGGGGEPLFPANDAIEVASPVGAAVSAATRRHMAKERDLLGENDTKERFHLTG